MVSVKDENDVFGAGENRTRRKEQAEGRYFHGDWGGTKHTGTKEFFLTKERLHKRKKTDRGRDRLIKVTGKLGT